MEMIKHNEQERHYSLKRTEEKPKSNPTPHKVEKINIDDILGVPFDTVKKYGEVNGVGFKLKHETDGVVLIIGERKILKIKQKGNEIFFEKYVPDPVIRGLLSITKLGRIEQSLKLGKCKETDLKEAERFLEKEMRGDWYAKLLLRRDITAGKLIKESKPKDEYSEAHPYLENVKKELRDNPRALFVNMAEGAIADSETKDWIYTVNAVNCSILILYDKKSKTGAVVHFSADEMDSEEVDRFIKKFIKLNKGKTENLEVHINFGWTNKDLVLLLEPLEKNGLITKIVDTNLSYKILQKEPLFFVWTESRHDQSSENVSVGKEGSGNIADSYAINLKTGRVYRIKEGEMYDAIDGGKERLYQINPSISNPPVFMKK